MNERTTRRASPDLGFGSRGLAWRFVVVLVFGTALGSTLPETGDLLALRLNIWPHEFNIVFCIIGFIGVGLAFYLRHRSSRLRNKVLVVRDGSQNTHNASSHPTSEGY